MVLGCFAHCTWAVDADPHTDQNKDTKVEMTPKTLDGVFIEAVENYPNLKNQEIGLGLGLYPAKPYYTAFSLYGDYVKYFSTTFAWEIINASAAFTVDTDLTSQLAQKYSVNPSTIDRLQATFSSNVMFIHSHGKVLFLNQYIKYFRSMVLGGLGLVTTSNESRVAASLGLRFDAFVTDSFSWKLEVRDMITFSGFENFAVVTLGTGFSF
jgi:hypothetical protein